MDCSQSPATSKTCHRHHRRQYCFQRSELWAVMLTMILHSLVTIQIAEGSEMPYVYQCSVKDFQKTDCLNLGTCYVLDTYGIRSAHCKCREPWTGMRCQIDLRLSKNDKDMEPQKATSEKTFVKPKWVIPLIAVAFISLLVVSSFCIIRSNAAKKEDRNKDDSSDDGENERYVVAMEPESSG